jgi:4-amino-4-deoxy-L-arabinose transferase-like glycosyltransferase
MNGYSITSRLGLAAFVVFLAVVNLESTPPLWWDEGWTLTAARNWVERGYYGPFLDGQPAARGMEGAFSYTLPIAFSFQVLGVGVYQGRLVGVVFTFATVALLYFLARRLYSRSIALATLAVLMLMSPHVDIHPLLMGRQVLGEIPAMFFLLAGYACFLLSGTASLWFMPAAMFFWSLALITKTQVPPFWAVSLIVPWILVLYQRNWKLVGVLLAGFVGSIILSLGWQQLILRFKSIPPPPVSGMTQLIALALDRHTRSVVLIETLRFGLPTLLGLSWGLWSYLYRRQQVTTHKDVVRVALFILPASWFAWYECLSVGWPRYLFPSAFVGSIFVAAMVYDWTTQFNLASTIQKAGSALKTIRFSRDKLAALASVVLITTSFGQTLKILYGAYVIEADDSIKDVVRFLNTNTSPNALIETYESELFFLLDRPYHYPPDQVHVDLIRRNSFGQSVNIDYDPLAANPDYLVVGPQSKFWDFYDPYLKTGDFRLLRDYSRYQIYERVR